MPYITTFERNAMLMMVREDVIEVLETRFEAVPQELKDSINEIEDLARLKRLHKRAITVASVNTHTVPGGSVWACGKLQAQLTSFSS